MITADRSPAPMAFAEAAECCGEYRRDAGTEEVGTRTCANCPLLLDRKREDFLRLARAS